MGEKVGNSAQIKVFLRAKTPEELVDLQIERNLKDSAQYMYQIMVGPDGLWYAWYEKDIRTEIRARKRKKARQTKIVKIP